VPKAGDRPRHQPERPGQDLGQQPGDRGGGERQQQDRQDAAVAHRRRAREDHRVRRHRADDDEPAAVARMDRDAPEVGDHRVAGAGVGLVEDEAVVGRGEERPDLGELPGDPALGARVGGGDDRPVVGMVQAFPGLVDDVERRARADEGGEAGEDPAEVELERQHTHELPAGAVDRAGDDHGDLLVLPGLAWRPVVVVGGILRAVGRPRGRPSAGRDLGGRILVGVSPSS
jgi:hypothetical protein